MRGLRGLIVATVVAATLVGCGNDESIDLDWTETSGATSKDPTATTSKKPATTTATTTATTVPPPPLNIANIETRIANQLNKPTGSQPPSIVDAVVVCPKDETGGVGKSFDCDVTATTGTNQPVPGEALTGSAEVTLIDAEGKEFSLEYELSGENTDIEGSAPKVP